MVNISETKDNFKPFRVLIVYKNTLDSYNAKLPPFFVISHEIRNDGNLGVGSPLTEAFLQGLMSEYSRLTYLSERVIAQSTNAVLWWKPASITYLSFAKETGVKSGRYPMPPMLFMLNRYGLYNWALKGDSRPIPETKIYCSPFYNVYEDGRCCMGNVKTPDNMNIEKWEMLFLGSTCTNELAPRFAKETAKEVWNGLEGENIFPVEILAPTDRAVKNIIGGRQ